MRVVVHSEASAEKAARFSKLKRRRASCRRLFVLAAAVGLSSQSVSKGGLTFYVDPGGWPSGWYGAAVANMQTVVNEYNAYGDFTANNGGSIYVYYNAGIPTEQASYGGWGGSVGVGNTYPNVRVLLHESSHWLGTELTAPTGPDRPPVR